MRKKSTIIILLILMVLTSCKSTPKPLLLQKIPDEVVFKDSNNIDIDIYIDDTVSMGGFATNGVASSFVNIIPVISSISTSLSGTLGKVCYFSFGEKIINISQAQFINAGKSSFYINKKTDVGSVIKRACDNFSRVSRSTEKSKVSIIISDLFEDNSNVDPLITNMKKSFNESELSIGFLGVRSYFNGKVFDIGRNIDGRLYSSDIKKNTTYRPFYVTILGKPGDVQKYYKELNKIYLNGLPKNTNYFEFFSKYNVLNTGTLKNDVEITAQQKKRARIKIDPTINSSDKDTSIQGLKVYIGGVPENDKTDEFITAELGVNPVEFSRLKYAISNGKNIYSDKKDSLFSIKTKVEALTNGDYQEVNGLADNCIKNAKVSLKDGGLKTTIELNPYKLEEGYYRISATVDCDYDILTPVIPADWNMKDENDPSFGSKTINLYNLLEGFYGMAKGNEKPLAQVYYYLKVIS